MEEDQEQMATAIADIKKALLQIKKLAARKSKVITKEHGEKSLRSTKSKRKMADVWDLQAKIEIIDSTVSDLEHVII